ncbi:ankyrin repeat-containing domain protein [Nemania serpens]|nr:ankyrin repeat-containing domain protein [Nemania serpens]
MAALNGHLDVVKFLFENQADIMIANKDGWTPLHVASDHGHSDVVKLLLGNDHYALIKDNLGRPPLFYAIKNSRDAVFHLLQPYQQADAEDHFGISALSIAARCGREHMVAQLLTIPDIDINSQDSCGRTPLWWACKQGYVKIAALLRKHASDFSFDIAVTEVDMGVPASFNIDGDYCDVCLASVDEAYYYCARCNGGNFVICRECHKLGGHCLVQSHILSQYELPS